MKNSPFRKFLSTAASATVLALFPIQNTWGQAAKVISEKPTFDEIMSPEFAGGKQKAFKPKEWLNIEAKMKVLMSPAPKSKTCEKMTVKWYVAVKNPEKSNTLLLLTKEVEHVNVPLDQDVFCSVYLSPASIRRLTHSDRASKHTVDHVGYEVFIRGEKVAQDTSKGHAGWWNVPSEKISKNDTVPLLNKNETPFRAMWWDRYAEISEQRAAKE